MPIIPSNIYHQPNDPVEFFRNQTGADRITLRHEPFGPRGDYYRLQLIWNSVLGEDFAYERSLPKELLEPGEYPGYMIEIAKQANASYAENLAKLEREKAKQIKATGTASMAIGYTTGAPIKPRHAGPTDPEIDEVAAILKKHMPHIDYTTDDIKLGCIAPFEPVIETSKLTDALKDTTQKVKEISKSLTDIGLVGETPKPNREKIVAVIDIDEPRLDPKDDKKGGSIITEQGRRDPNPPDGVRWGRRISWWFVNALGASAASGVIWWLVDLASSGG